MTTLSERLRIAMTGPPRITQAALARACGLKAPSVHDWLSGRTKRMSAEYLLPACELLRVNEKWLATGKGPMRSNQTDRMIELKKINELLLNLSNDDFEKIRRICETLAMYSVEKRNNFSMTNRKEFNITPELTNITGPSIHQTAQ